MCCVYLSVSCGLFCEVNASSSVGFGNVVLLASQGLGSNAASAGKGSRCMGECALDVSLWNVLSLAT